MNLRSPATLCAALALAGLTISSEASVVAALDAAVGQNSYDGSITTNLVQNGQSSLSSVTVDHGTSLSGIFPQSGLNDGSAATNGNLSYYSKDDTGALPTTIKFTLGNSALGYDITRIMSIAGWGDSFIGQQVFQLLLSTDNVTFLDYGTYSNNPTNLGDNIATRTTVTDTTGTIATGIKGVEFLFQVPGPSMGGSSGGTVIRELQVFGAATVPEPATAVLLGAAGLMSLASRRRRAL